MKKFFLILFLLIMFHQNVWSMKTKLVCQGTLEAIEGTVINVNFDDKEVEVVQGSGGNKVSFIINRFDERIISTKLRSLLKGDTSYDTHISNWDEWDSAQFKYHLYHIQINRITGVAHMMRSKKPFKEGKNEYKLISIDDGWELY